MQPLDPLMESTVFITFHKKPNGGKMGIQNHKNNLNHMKNFNEIKKDKN